MAIKRTDVTVGKRFKTILNPKLNANQMDTGYPELEVYGEPGGVFQSCGKLPIGTEVEIVVAPRKVPSTSMCVDIRLVEDPEGRVYSCFWIWFKKRVEEV